MYSEPLKNKARSLALNNAIAALTSDRDSVTLARRSYVREVRDHILSSDHPYDKIVASELSDETIDNWENFYDSVTQAKDCSNLKVAYLSGPNPENDLRVICEAGILPENIWAFESENKVYSQAVASALNSEFPFIKLINGNIQSFVEVSPQKFDIIYLDFCGPLPSRNTKQKTLGAITKILSNHAINSPGILITNLSLPTELQDSSGRELISKLVATYLYPKESLEDSTGDMVEGPVFHEHDFETWLNIVQTDLDIYYGQFISRVLLDNASQISACDKVFNTVGIFNKLFDIKDSELLKAKLNSLFHFNDDGDGGDTIVDPGAWPILWSIGALDPTKNQKDKAYPQWIFNDPNFASFSDRFLSQLNADSSKNKFVDSVQTISFLLSERGNEFLSKTLSDMNDEHRIDQYYQFCDLVLFHQTLELIFRQLSGPYHINVEKSLRWRYTAKDTPMYMDMFVLDECRYLYDWMPTMDMLSKGLDNIERQLSYRFALDGVSKHSYLYNTEYFFGTSVVDVHIANFEAKEFSARKLIE